MSKTLIIVRHAHRDKPNPEGDNGLSKKGKEQATVFLNSYKKKFKEKKPLLVSSPKKRCVETLLPLANDYHSEVQEKDFLNEGEGDGNPLRMKIEEFRSWWQMQNENVVIACSHGDLIPPLLRVLTGARLDLKKGGWAEIEENNGRTRLTRLVSPD